MIGCSRAAWGCSWYVVFISYKARIPDSSYSKGVISSDVVSRASEASCSAAVLQDKPNGERGASCKFSLYDISSLSHSRIRAATTSHRFLRLVLSLCLSSDTSSPPM